MSGLKRKPVIAAGLGLGAALLIAHSLERNRPTPPPSAADKAADARQKLATQEATITAFSEQQVRASLTDPASATFEGVFGRTRHGLHVACGQVNAKNSFGAYAGAAFFVVEEDTGEVIVQSPQTEVRFQRAWTRDCTGRGDEAPAPPSELFGIAWGRRPPTSLKPYNAARQVWVYRTAPPARYLGVPVKTVEYELDQGRIFGADVIATGQDAYDQLKARLTDLYGEPTTEISANGYTAWDWGKGSGLVQLSWSATSNEADVHLEREATR